MEKEKDYLELNNILIKILHSMKYENQSFNIKTLIFIFQII